MGAQTFTLALLTATAMAISNSYFFIIDVTGCLQNKDENKMLTDFLHLTGHQK